MFFKKYRKGLVSVIVYVVLGGIMFGQASSLENVARQGELIKIKGVPIIKQYPELPTGCEATALTMLLKYNGVGVTKCDIANHMPKLDLPYYKKGKRYGYHPSQGFIGNPYSSSSYGVYAPVIAKMIEDYLPERGENLTGKSFEELLKNIDEGIPVMIWVTMGMGKVSYTNEWIINSKGTVFRWPGGEHAVVIVGYDKSYIYINDPYTGTEKRYSRGLVEKRFIELGKQAIRIRSKEVAQKEEISTIQIDMMLNERPLEIVEGLRVSYDKGVIDLSHRGKLEWLYRFFLIPYAVEEMTIEIKNISSS